MKKSPFLLAAALGLLALTAPAYPPAPHHLLYGLVRDELGNPLAATTAEVVLETATGVQLKTTIIPNLRPGMNYQLAVPMDAGLTSTAYRPTALRPLVSFRLKVLLNGVTFLPIEMAADYSKLGQPAQQTRLDLTLGEDRDGDGLPDAWERMLMAMSGGRLTDLSQVRPQDDFDGDGLSNLQEYLLGTYAFDPQDGFRLDIVGWNAGQPLLEFMAVRGRGYTLSASSDLQSWQPVSFRLAGADPAAGPQSVYQAADTRVVRVQAVYPGLADARQVFFKAQVR